MLLNGPVLSADFIRSNANVILSAMLVLERSDRDIFYVAIPEYGHTYNEGIHRKLFLRIPVTVSRFERGATRLRVYIVTAAPFYSLLATSQLNFHGMGHTLA